ncbi:MAG: GntR family transcriptional regulator [Dehalococcoidia bacterium]
MSPGLPLNRIERATLGAQIAEQIRTSVLQGAFEPGHQLSEIALAEHFGTSRGPIREALQTLVNEGLLKRESHRGVFVPVVTDEDIADIYRARGAVETAAMKHIIAVGSGADVRTRLDKVVDEMAAAADADEWARVVDLEMQFHSEVVKGADSPRLSRMYSTLIDETRLCLILTIASPGRYDLVDEHRHLAALLDTQDPQPAIEAVEAHMREATEALHRQRAEKTSDHGTQ